MSFIISPDIGAVFPPIVFDSYARIDKSEEFEVTGEPIEGPKPDVSDHQRRKPLEITVVDAVVSLKTPGRLPISIQTTQRALEAMASRGQMCVLFSKRDGPFKSMMLTSIRESEQAQKWARWTLSFRRISFAPSLGAGVPAGVPGPPGEGTVPSPVVGGPKAPGTPDGAALGFFDSNKGFVAATLDSAGALFRSVGDLGKGFVSVGNDLNTVTAGGLPAPVSPL